MQAIILAAGMGKRLKEFTDDNTKCMLSIDGKRLIDRSLDALTNAKELSRIVIVVGYKAENLKQHLGDSYNGTKIVYVENPIFDKTNNIYSLFLAKEYLGSDDTLLLESDLIFNEEIIKKLVEHPYPNLACVDKFESWMDGTVVVIDEDQNIINFIDRKLFSFSEIHSYYKTVNIYKFSKEFSESQYIPFLEAYSKALGNNEYYEQVLKVISFMDKSAIKALPLQGEKWYEIDDVQDLDIAQSMFAANDDKQWQAYTFRYGGYWRYPKLIDFCYLVNPYFPSKTMIEEMKSSFEILLCEYPSGIGVNSLLAAKYFNIKKEYVVVGNGAAELIKIYIEKYVGCLGVVFPTFEEYPNRMSADRIVRYIPDNDDFAYSADDLINYFSDKIIDTLLLINPDNPSGNYLSYNDLMRIVKWSEQNGIKIIIDESFVDFADVDGLFSMLDNQVLKENSHMIVIKSISKSYGVPGLRLGVLASGNLDLISQIKKDVSIWNINSFGEFYMQIFGKYEKDYKRACKLFIEERTRFYECLQEISFLRVIKSEANYFLCEVVSAEYTSRSLAIYLLKKHEILIKDCSSKEAFNGRQYVRIAVRNTTDNNHLVECLKKMEVPK